MRLLALALAAATTVVSAQNANQELADHKLGNDHGLDARNFDAKAGACRDFFQYANGGWLKANPIPAAYSRWSLDDEINERNEALLKSILEQASATHADAGSTQQKVGDFYAAAMNEAGS